MEVAIALVALTLMEIVLGIDNIVFIAILTGRLPKEQQANARRLGLGLALGLRILLLLAISWIMGLTAPIFEFSQLGIATEWLHETENEEINVFTWKDLVMLVGGLFLLWKAVMEIHKKFEGEEHEEKIPEKVSFSSVLVQIAILDVVFSLDSVITAVGMVKDKIWVMITAVTIAIAVMLIFAGQVSSFIEKHPTLKMLALSFLILIGVVLISEGIGTHINKGYIYFAMAFSLAVELLNLRVRALTPKKPKAA